MRSYDGRQLYVEKIVIEMKNKSGHIKERISELEDGTEEIS